jgi:hypothetical protein
VRPFGIELRTKRSGNVKSRAQREELLADGRRKEGNMTRIFDVSWPNSTQNLPGSNNNETLSDMFGIISSGTGDTVSSNCGPGRADDCILTKLPEFGGPILNARFVYLPERHRAKTGFDKVPCGPPSPTPQLWLLPGCGGLDLPVVIREKNITATGRVLTPKR